MINNGVNHSSLIRPVAKLLAPTNKSQFWSYDEPDGDNWNYYIMHGEKLQYTMMSYILKNVKGFTLRSHVLKIIIEQKFNKTHSPEAKLIVDIMDEMQFDIHSRGKKLIDGNLMKNYFSKRAILASGLKTIFLSKNPNELYDKLKILLEENPAGKISDQISQENVAIIDKLLKYKCITSTQKKKKFLR